VRNLQLAVLFFVPSYAFVVVNWVNIKILFLRTVNKDKKSFDAPPRLKNEDLPVQTALRAWPSSKVCEEKNPASKLFSPIYYLFSPLKV
jgi:hypothetical protein